MKASEFGDSGAYYRALAAIERERLHPRHREMLEAHYSAPRHTITMVNLAAAVGYPSWRAANLQYGHLARRVGQALGMLKPPLSDKYPGGFWGYVLMDWATGSADGGDTRFVMRAELVAAIDQLGWVMGQRRPRNR
jgi:hypothetical protein